MNPDLFCKAGFLCVVFAKSRGTPITDRAQTVHHMIRLIQFPDLTLAPKSIRVLNCSPLAFLGYSIE